MPNTNPSDLDREALNKAYEAYDKAFPESGFITYEGLRAGIRAYLEALPRASGVPEAEAVAWRLLTRNNWGREKWEYLEKSEADAEPLYAALPPVAAPSGEAVEEAYERGVKMGRMYECYSPTVPNDGADTVKLRQRLLNFASIFSTSHPLLSATLSNAATVLAAARTVATPSREPDAWVFELARACNSDTGEYYLWGHPQISFTTPDVNSAGVRNIKPLYFAPPSPIASEPKDAGSGEGQQLTKLRQAEELYEAARQADRGVLTDPEDVIAWLHKRGYRITRTTLSGAKLGESEK